MSEKNEAQRANDIINRVMKNIQSGKGTIQMLNYYHDEWCPKLKGGECCCNPDTKLEVLA